MFSFFGRKKIKAEDLAPTFVNTIYEVIENGFPEIAGYINEEKEFRRSPNISDKDNEWFVYIIYAGNLIQIEQHFDKTQTDLITTLIAQEITRKIGKDPDTAHVVLYDYISFLRELFAQTKNLAKAMSLAIFHKYDLNKYQKEHFQKLNTPSPLVMKELNDMVEFFLWNWEDYLSKYKVVV